MALNFTRIVTGLQIQPKSSTSVSLLGDLDITNDGNINYYNGTSADFLAQLNLPQTLLNKTLTLPIINGFSANRVVISNNSGVFDVFSTTTTQLSFLDATSSIQTQLNTLSATPDHLTLVELASTPANPSSGQLKIYAKTNNLLYYLNSSGAETQIPTSGGAGTVTSVGLTLPSIFSVSGSPVTTTGTLVATLSSQSANKVFASPNGSSGTPTFRQILSADISSGAASASQVLTADGLGGSSWSPPPGSIGATASGFFTAADVWSTSSTSFVDPTSVGSNVFTTRLSNGLTIAKAAGSLPGIVFTPASTSAVYQITAAASVTNGTHIQMTDGTTVIAGSGGFIQPTISNTTLFLQGPYQPGTTSPVTVKLQIALDSAVSGPTAANIENAYALPATCIEWTVTRII